jgi:hypothetical protein
VFEATGLKCSVGIAPNKLIAKIASELDKPDGLTVVGTHDIPTRIWPLPVRRINGVGPKAATKLGKLGIESIGELAQVDPRVLRAQFGASYGAWLHAAAHGRDERPIVTESEPKSISRETTFERDLHAVRDRAELSRVFTWLAERVADDMQRKGYAGRTIGIKLRFEDFRTVTRDLTLDAPTADAKAIRRAAGLCLKRIDLARRIRLLGVRAGALEPLATVDAGGVPSWHLGEDGGTRTTRLLTTFAGRHRARLAAPFSRRYAIGTARPWRTCSGRCPATSCSSCTGSWRSCPWRRTRSPRPGASRCRCAWPRRSSSRRSHAG